MCISRMLSWQERSRLSALSSWRRRRMGSHPAARSPTDTASSSSSRGGSRRRSFEAQLAVQLALRMGLQGGVRGRRRWMTCGGACSVLWPMDLTRTLGRCRSRYGRGPPRNPRFGLGPGGTASDGLHSSLASEHAAWWNGRHVFALTVKRSAPGTVSAINTVPSDLSSHAACVHACWLLQASSTALSACVLVMPFQSHFKARFTSRCERALPLQASSTALKPEGISWPLSPQRQQQVLHCIHWAYPQDRPVTLLYIEVSAMGALASMQSPCTVKKASSLCGTSVLVAAPSNWHTSKLGSIVVLVVGSCVASHSNMRVLGGALPSGFPPATAR